MSSARSAALVADQLVTLIAIDKRIKDIVFQIKAVVTASATTVTIADGKTPREARRCLKGQVSDAIHHQHSADAQAAERGPGGQMGATTKIGAAGPRPRRSTLRSSITGAPTEGVVPPRLEHLDNGVGL